MRERERERGRLSGARGRRRGKLEEKLRFFLHFLGCGHGDGGLQFSKGLEVMMMVVGQGGIRGSISQHSTLCMVHSKMKCLLISWSLFMD